MHIYELDAFFKNFDKNTLWGLREVYLPRILTEESDGSKHQRLFSSVMRTHLEFVIEFGFPDSIITTTKNLVRLFAQKSGVDSYF